MAYLLTYLLLTCLLACLSTCCHMIRIIREAARQAAVHANSPDPAAGTLHEQAATDLMSVVRERGQRGRTSAHTSASAPTTGKPVAGNGADSEADTSTPSADTVVVHMRIGDILDMDMVRVVRPTAALILPAPSARPHVAPMRARAPLARPCARLLRGLGSRPCL